MGDEGEDLRSIDFVNMGECIVSVLRSFLFPILFSCSSPKFQQWGQLMPLQNCLDVGLHKCSRGSDPFGFEGQGPESGAAFSSQK